MLDKFDVEFVPGEYPKVRSSVVRFHNDWGAAIENKVVDGKRLVDVVLLWREQLIWFDVPDPLRCVMNDWGMACNVKESQLEVIFNLINELQGSVRHE